MSKKTKKAMSMLLVVTLIAVIAVGGMLAYLQSTDSDVNVMTLGEVKIEQIEQQRDANGNLVEFRDAKPAYPAVGPIDWAEEGVIVNGTEYKVFTDDLKNVVDKIVTVKNIGKSDAFVRTIVAMEAPGFDAKNLIHVNVNGAIASTPWTGVIIDGVEYVYSVFTYPEALKPNEISAPSLIQVFLDSAATNEDVAKFSDTWEIKVLSQAVQAAGFDTTGKARIIADAENALNTAWGEANSDNVQEWFKNLETPSVLSAPAAIHGSTEKSGIFVLGKDIETSGDATVPCDTRYGYSYEYIIRKGADYTLDLNGKTIEHKAINKNANNNALTYLFVANNAGTKLTIDGPGTVHCENSEGYTCAIQGKDGTLITVNGGDYEVDNGIAVWAGAGAHIVINGGSYVNGNAKTDHELIYSSGGVIDIYGGFFHNTDGNYTLNVEDRNRSTGFINVYGGTYVNFDPSTGGQDPNNIKVADGYKVVSETQANGDIWYKVVAE